MEKAIIKTVPSSANCKLINSRRQILSHFACVCAAFLFGNAVAGADKNTSTGDRPKIIGGQKFNSNKTERAQSRNEQDTPSSQCETTGDIAIIRNATNQKDVEPATTTFQFNAGYGKREIDLSGVELDSVSNEYFTSHPDDYHAFLRFLEKHELLGSVVAVRSNGPTKFFEPDFFAKLKKLRQLELVSMVDLEHCDFPRIKKITLKSPERSDVLLLSKYKTLTSLELNKFSFRDSDLILVSSLPQLESLGLFLNDDSVLTPHAFSCLRQCSKLSQLGITNIKPSVDLAKELSEISALKKLYFDKPSDPMLLDQICAELGKLEQLTNSNYLSMENESDFERLRFFPQIKNLEIERLTLSAKMLDNIMSLRELVRLSISRTDVPNGTFSKILTLPKLKELSLTSSKINTVGDLKSITKPNLSINLEASELNDEQLKSILSIGRANLVQIPSTQHVKDELLCSIDHFAVSQFDFTSCAITEKSVAAILQNSDQNLKSIVLFNTQFNPDSTLGKMVIELAKAKNVQLIR